MVKRNKTDTTNVKCSLQYLIMLCIFLISCNTDDISDSVSEADIELNIHGARNTFDSDPETISDYFLSFHLNIMNIFQTKTSDIVFISDPFFAVNYYDENVLGYGGFYAISNRMRKNAKMFVILEAQDRSVHEINIGNISAQFPTLSEIDLLYIRYAKKVVVSPLLKLFAPIQYQAIVDIRESDGNDVLAIAYDKLGNDGTFSSINHIPAMKELGLIAAEIASKRSQSAPYVYLLLDSSNINAISDRINYFLQALYQTNPHITVYLSWELRDLQTEEEILKELAGVPQNAVILVDAGVYSYSIVSRYINTHYADSSKWKDRFMLVTGMSPENFKYQLPVAAKVYLPQDLIFQKNDIIKSKISRRKN